MLDGPRSAPRRAAEAANIGGGGHWRERLRPGTTHDGHQTSGRGVPSADASVRLLYMVAEVASAGMHGGAAALGVHGERVNR
jgi:hypothetical protein